MDYIRIPPDSTLVIGNFTLDPSIPLPVIRTEEDKKNGDVAIASIKAGLINAISHKGGLKDDILDENFDYYKDIILSEEDAIKNMLLAAKVRIEKKDFENAETLLKAVLNLEKIEEAFIMLSTVYGYRAKEYENKDEKMYDGYDSLILETLKAGYSVFKDSVNLPFELGSFHFREGNFELAENYFETFLKRADDDDVRRKPAEKLLQKCKKHIEDEDNVSEIYDLVMTNRFDEAEEKVKKLYKSHENDYQYNLLYGWTLRNAKKFDEAQGYLMKALKLDGHDAELYNELSLVEWEIGDKQRAKEYMSLAVDIDDESTIYPSNLAMMCFELSDIEEAEKAIYLLIERDKNDPYIKMLVDVYNQLSKDKFVYPDGFEGEDDEHECGCDHHHEHGHECECGHHHEHDHECECGHHHEHDHECGCGHDHEHDHECGCGHDHDHECECGHHHEHDHECECGHHHDHEHNTEHEKAQKTSKSKTTQKSQKKPTKK